MTTKVPITCPFSEDEISAAWEKCGYTVQSHCDQMVERWKEEIDMFLVFVRHWLFDVCDLSLLWSAFYRPVFFPRCSLPSTCSRMLCSSKIIRTSLQKLLFVFPLSWTASRRAGRPSIPLFPNLIPQHTPSLDMPCGSTLSGLLPSYAP